MNLGDFKPGDILRFKFTTVNASGVPTTLAGTPVISVYKDDSVAESVAGVSLTPDFDARTGMHHVVIDTSADLAFYTDLSQFEVAITTGTVGGSSVVGYVPRRFTLGMLAGLMTAGTAQAGTPTSVTLPAGDTAPAGFYVGGLAEIVAGIGAGQTPRVVVAYDDTTKIATVDPNWNITPDATSILRIYRTAPSTSVVGDVQTGLGNYQAATNTDVNNVETDTQDIQSRLPAALVNGKMDSSVEGVKGQTLNPSPKPYGVPT